MAKPLAINCPEVYLGDYKATKKRFRGIKVREKAKVSETPKKALAR